MGLRVPECVRPLCDATSFTSLTTGASASTAAAAASASTAAAAASASTAAAAALLVVVFSTAPAAAAAVMSAATPAPASTATAPATAPSSVDSGLELGHVGSLSHFVRAAAAVRHRPDEHALDRRRKLVATRARL